MICEECGHIYINEFVDVYQSGFGDNKTEYTTCPECGHKQVVHPVELSIDDHEETINP